MIVTIGSIAMGAWIAGCAPGYVESRPAHPVYGPNYGYGYGDARHERHEAREHEEHEAHEHGHDGWRAPEDHD
jgi:hypothetical protein